VRTVGLRELKNRLSEYVRHVRAGERIGVTDRGQIVAELLPPVRPEEGRALESGLADLERRGLLKPARGKNSRRLYSRLPRRLKEGELEDLLLDVRGPR
jgi:prevent-host-death family protein